MDKRENDHLIDEQLLLHADGELTGRQAEVVRNHLDACWSCRARLDELQATIHTVVRFRNEVLLPGVPPPSDPWPGLRPRLESAEQELQQRSIFRGLIPERRIGRTLMGIAAAALFVAFLSTDSASAAAAHWGGLLARFTAYVTGFVRTPVAPSVAVVASPPVRVEPAAVPPTAVVTPVAPTKPATVPRRLTSRELVELEFNAVSRLDQVGAFLGEQLTVERDARRGQIRINAIVETATRKSEILAALGSLSSHRAVVVDVATVAEAVANQTPPTGPAKVRAVEIDTTPVPVHEDLRRYVIEKWKREHATSRQLEPDEELIKREIQSFTVRVLNRSLQARLHARALVQAVDRFSPEEVRSLSAADRKNWRQMIQQHALAVQRETVALRNDLQPVFFASPISDDVDADLSVSNDADVARAAAQLFELGSSHDAIIARTFSRSSGEPNPKPPAWQPFFQSVKAAEHLAAFIAKAASSE